MAGSGAKSSYWRGFRHAVPFLPVVFPFGMLFGVLATEAGLNVFEALTFSLVVVAGASQFTALQLLQDNAPTWVALLSALAVNMRMAMYSASITPYLGAAKLRHRVVAAYFLVDQTYAQSILEFEKKPNMSVAERLGYFLGSAMVICTGWYVATAIGAGLGQAIPAELGLDFALPIAFLAMLGPLLRTGAHMAAALAAIVVALACAGLPYNLGLIVGGLAGMVTGARVERWITRETTS